MTIVATALVILAFFATATAAHNITEVLDGFPDYSLYNSYLTQTKVADEINSRGTVTCLVLPNAAMAELADKRSLSSIKNALRLLTLLDYFDPTKLHNLPGGAITSTTLLQTTGEQKGKTGFVNISDVRGGVVAFSSAAPALAPPVTYAKSVRQVPYNLSVLEISGPIVFPGLLDGDSSSANLTEVLLKAGCKTFAALLSSTGVLKVFEDTISKGLGLTVLAPNDEAFKVAGVPNVTSLSSAELVTLLQFHALPAYAPKATLAAARGEIPTIASNGAGKFEISATARGDDVTIDTGVDTSRIASTALDETPVCVLTVDSVLLPEELFGHSPAPAPANTAPSPAPSNSAPSPAPFSDLAPASAAPPSPLSVSPPAGSPDDSPAEAPAADLKSDVKKADAVTMPVVDPTAAAAAMAAAVFAFVL